MRATMSLRGAGLLVAALLCACTEKPQLVSDLAVPPPDATRVLTVTGTGRMAEAPGQVEFDCVAGVDAPTPDAAWLAGSARTTRLTAGLESAGVLPEDMQLRDVTLTVPASGGYRVEQRLHVLVRDFNRLPPVLAAALGSGASAIESTRFGLADPRAASDRARERALLAARDTAEMLAQEVGLRLGEVRSVVEQPASAAAGSSDGGARDDAPGSLEVLSTVTVTYALLD